MGLNTPSTHRGNGPRQTELDCHPRRRRPAQLLTENTDTYTAGLPLPPSALTSCAMLFKNTRPVPHPADGSFNSLTQLQVLMMHTCTDLHQTQIPSMLSSLVLCCRVIIHYIQLTNGQHLDTPHACQPEAKQHHAFLGTGFDCSAGKILRPLQEEGVRGMRTNTERKEEQPKVD